MFSQSAHSLNVELSEKIRTFGFELEPDRMDDLTFTVEFFNGSNLVEEITRTVDGDSGARLFAHRGKKIDRIVITGEDEFAIAQVRYQALLTSEQQTFLILLGLLLIIMVAFLL